MPVGAEDANGDGAVVVVVAVVVDTAPKGLGTAVDELDSGAENGFLGAVVAGAEEEPNVESCETPPLGAPP